MAINKTKIISIFSTKGGVGKTVLLLSMTGLFSSLKKKVLLLDMDLCSGGIGVSLNVENNKTMYNLVDDLNNNRFSDIKKYTSSYNEYIDVIISPIDPRESNKIDANDINKIMNLNFKDYDFVLIDTNHILNNHNLFILDNSDCTLLIVTNDPIDLKNMKSLVSIFKDTKKENYRMILNSSRDTDKDYLTIFDIKNIIKDNIDYTISKSFHIKDIDKYTLDGEILTLNKKILSKKKKDIDKLKMIVNDMINDEVRGDEND